MVTTKRTTGLATDEFNIDEMTYVGTCSCVVSLLIISRLMGVSWCYRWL